MFTASVSTASAFTAAVNVTSLGYRTDLMIRRMEGSEVTDCRDHIVVRSPAHPAYWWGNCAGAIRVYRSVGFAGTESQIGFQRAPCTAT